MLDKDYHFLDIQVHKWLCYNVMMPLRLWLELLASTWKVDNTSYYVGSAVSYGFLFSCFNLPYIHGLTWDQIMFSTNVSVTNWTSGIHTAGIVTQWD
jgi:hypothetical protein